MRTSFGTNIVEAQRKRVYYTETASTIYEGMPVCYEFDATTNVLGWDKGNSAVGTTTAEGNQNEGKYIRVEDPDADNIHAFAGVVAGTSEAGKLGGRWIDIFVANGAIVPVRADQNCVVGRTVLAVHTAEQHLTAPFEVAGRAVAVAWETKDCATTTGIVLAKLDPNLFICQKGDAAALMIDDEDTGNIMLNQIWATTAQASGLFSALQIKAWATGGAESWDYGLALNVSANMGTGTYAGIGFTASGHWLEPGSCTIAGGGHVCALRAGIYEGGDTTFTSCSSLAALSLAVQVATDPGTGFCMIYARNDGAQALDAFIILESAAAGLVTASDAGASTHKMPIIIGGTTRYIMISDG